MATRTESRTITEPTAADVTAINVVVAGGVATRVRVYYRRGVDGEPENRDRELDVSALPAGAQTALAALLIGLLRVAAQREGF